MLLTVLLCSAISAAELEDRPASALEAIDAALVARLPDHFCEPDVVLQTLLELPVARVNGEAVPAGRVLTQYTTYLLVASGHASAGKFSLRVEQLIQRDLPGVIQSVALEQVVLRELPPEQIEALRAYGTKSWQHQLLRLAHELKDSDNPLPLSLEVMQQDYVRHAMLHEYLSAKADEAEPLPNLNELDQQSRQAYWKKREAAMSKVLDEIVKRAKIETAYALDWPVKAK